MSKELSSTDHYLFRRARELAEFGEHRVRVGCVAAIKGTTICGAFNTHRNLPSVEYPYCTNHAESNAIDGIPYDKKNKVTLYVARISVAGYTQPSHPCVKCIARMIYTGIKYVVYYDGKILVKETPKYAKPR